MALYRFLPTVTLGATLFLSAIAPLQAAEPPLQREEALSFCAEELSRRIGQEEAQSRLPHCECVVDLAMTSTPQDLQSPLSRIVRRQHLSSDDQAALRAAGSQAFVYLALIGQQCPQVFKDPLIQQMVFKKAKAFFRLTFLR